MTSTDAALDLTLEFDYSENPSFIWSIPLFNDMKHFFATQKRAVTVRGDYNFNGKKQKCIDKECHMMIDIGRGAFNYGVAYFWVLIMTTLPDGRTVQMSLGDGIGSEYRSLDKASEDFIVVDGKMYKLDITQMDYYKD